MKLIDSEPEHSIKSPEPVVARPAFSQELRNLAEKFSDRPVRLSEILEATQGRGFDLLLVFIALPFLTPIPLPGFSVPFGLVAFFIGARLAAGRKPWLPQKLLERELPPQLLGKVLKAAGRVVRVLEVLLRPRWLLFHESLVFRRLAGLFIMLCGLMLVLPLPLPFSNSLPAFTVLLLAAGGLERDGLFSVAGSFLFVVSAAYFVFLAMGGAHLVDALWHSFTGI